MRPSEISSSGALAGSPSYGARMRTWWPAASNSAASASMWRVTPPGCVHEYGETRATRICLRCLAHVAARWGPALLGTGKDKVRHHPLMVGRPSRPSANSPTTNAPVAARPRVRIRSMRARSVSPGSSSGWAWQQVSPAGPSGLACSPRVVEAGLAQVGVGRALRARVEVAEQHHRQLADRGALDQLLRLQPLDGGGRRRARDLEVGGDAADAGHVGRDPPARERERPVRASSSRACWRSCRSARSRRRVSSRASSASRSREADQDAGRARAARRSRSPWRRRAGSAARGARARPRAASRWSAATSSPVRHSAASWSPIRSGSAAAISPASATARVAKSVRWTRPGGSPGLKIAATAAGSPARPSVAASAR